MRGRESCVNGSSAADAACIIFSKPFDEISLKLTGSKETLQDKSKTGLLE